MTSMKTIKTAELTGVALDWVVSKCEGVDVTYLYAWDYSRNKYSTDWAQGGPIIEREKIAIDFDGHSWCASDNAKPLANFGDTLLIAAMRCYVASKLGDTVEVPKELTT